MKLISFNLNNEETFGAVNGDDVINLKPLFEGEANTLKEVLEKDLLAKAEQLAANATATLKFADLELLPVIPEPGKIFCIGLNYDEHVKETNKEKTESPVIFLRVAESQVAHNDSIVLPPESVKLDYEGEIAIVIGKGGRRISEEDSWDHIAGYACYNDGSIRDWQTATSQWGPGKNFWKTGGFGPWMVTADEIEANQKMTLITRLNGVEMQRATTDMLIHSIPRQIAYISSFLPLNPGDVIVTGTPGGVGAKRNPPVFMKEGDVVEIEVDAVGVLRNTIAAEV
ncbi:fumarylacetoacetate hydrolase family protein [Advenella sp. WQ 585]|uniref:Fumarylacetoacetate hydrolase family protein n=1 Tax=Advenella mandrilli TaxID=2800330 RepID=A0ABS1E9B0_9BURK|nr:fumarylacetoacetate hydrolase family protein [Advenella mandrilli]MBK1779976.1 fumarylacetoacetate hydrolase family protein [Advenella mandrilli]